MLVLSRKLGEEICIGDDIVVSIVDIRGDKVRLGIAAPQDVSVHRREVYDGIVRDRALGLDPPRPLPGQPKAAPKLRPA